MKYTVNLVGFLAVAAGGSLSTTARPAASTFLPSPTTQKIVRRFCSTGDSLRTTPRAKAPSWSWSRWTPEIVIRGRSAGARPFAAPTLTSS
jgi:hypothetical protein